MAKKKQRKRGPEADRVAIEGDWREAVAKAVRMERPTGGWPDQEQSSEKPPGKRKNKA